MHRVASFLKRQRLVPWMLVLIALFYSALFLSQQFSGVPERALGKLQRLSAKELDQREARFKENLLARPALLSILGWFFLVGVGGGLGIDAWLLSRKIRKKPLFRPRVFSTADWKLKDVFEVFVFLFFFEICLLLLETAFLSVFHLKIAEPDLWVMANSLMRDLAAGLWVLWLVKRKYHESPLAIGWVSAPIGRDIRIGLIGYLAIVPALLLMLIGLSMAAKAFSYEPPPQHVVEMYLRQTGQSAIVFFTIFVAMAGPVIEEIIFRGFAYPAFRKRFGVTTAMTVTAVVFAAAHMSLIAFLPIVFLGLFLAYLYEKTGSLVPSITAHMAHNLIMVSFTLAFKALSS